MPDGSAASPPGATTPPTKSWILSELKIADVRSPVTLIFGDDFQGYAEFTPRALQEQRVTAMLDELTAWASALKTLR